MPRARFCLNGHDKWEVGYYSNGQCKECKRINSQRYKGLPKRERPMEAGPSIAATEMVLAILAAAETAPRREREEAKKRADEIILASRRRNLDS